MSDVMSSGDVNPAPLPQVTADPSLFSTTKACLFEYKPTQPEVSWAATELVSPPKTELPQATTLPSDFSAAMAKKPDTILVTPLDSGAASELASPA